MNPDDFNDMVQAATNGEYYIVQRPCQVSLFRRGQGAGQPSNLSTYALLPDGTVHPRDIISAFRSAGSPKFSEFGSYVATNLPFARQMLAAGSLYQTTEEQPDGTTEMTIFGPSGNPAASFSDIDDPESFSPVAIASALSLAYASEALDSAELDVLMEQLEAEIDAPQPEGGTLGEEEYRLRAQETLQSTRRITPTQLAARDARAGIIIPREQLDLGLALAKSGLAGTQAGTLEKGEVITMAALYIRNPPVGMGEGAPAHTRDLLIGRSGTTRFTRIRVFDFDGAEYVTTEEAQGAFDVMEEAGLTEDARESIKVAMFNYEGGAEGRAILGEIEKDPDRRQPDPDPEEGES